MRAVGVGEGGGGREGKLGGHIKTARGHRCWIIWKVWPSCAPPALSKCTGQRLETPQQTSIGLPSEPVSSSPKGINEPNRHPTSPLRLISAFFGLTPGLPHSLPLIFTSFEDTCTSTDGKRYSSDGYVFFFFFKQPVEDEYTISSGTLVIVFTEN